MEKHIGILTDNLNHRLDSIPDNGPLRKALDLMMEKTQDDYEGVSKIISTRYRPVNLIPGTIGSYLFGGSQKNYGDVSSECSPLYHDGIKQIQETCRNNVWVQKSSHGTDRFEQIIKNYNIPDVYIFVNDDFVEFTKNELKTFSDAGIVNLALLKTLRSQHYFFMKMTPLKDIKLYRYEKSVDKSEKMRNRLNLRSHNFMIWS